MKRPLNQRQMFIWGQLKVTLKAVGQEGLKVYRVTKIKDSNM